MFAGGILVLLTVAALAYDVGMMLLERRDSQNAADAAALAGARYVFEPDCVEPAWTCTKARAAAIAVALANGYDDADPSESVTLHIPPANGRFEDFPSFIEVDINSDRPSIFAKVIGRSSWAVGTFAVATNDQDLTFPFSMLALDPSQCKAIQVSGTGVIQAYGNVQSNSDGSAAGCGGIGMSRTGGGTINIIADDATCRAAGQIQDQGSGTMTCTKAEDSFALPDPLRNLAAPTKPALAAFVQQVGHTKPIEKHCPGYVGAARDSFTETQTTGCDVAGNGGSTSGTAWLLSPGLYPAGLSVDNSSRVFMLPGIYYIGGGGLQVDGTASLISVDSVATATYMNTNWATYANVKAKWGTNGGGVLIYNSKLPTSPGGEISIGGGGGRLLLKAFFDPVSTPPDAVEIYNKMSIFQDRTVNTKVTLGGSSAEGEVAGIVYIPAPDCPPDCLTINGSASPNKFIVDQIIADSFKLNGNGGTIEILRRVSVDAIIIAAGLVD